MADGQPPASRGGSKPFWKRRAFLIAFPPLTLAVIISLVAIFNGGANTVGAGRPLPTPTVYSPMPTSVSASSSGSLVPSVSLIPSAPFTSQVLLNVSGSGSYTTARFTVGGNGDWDIQWSYSSGNSGGQVNFQIFGDGGSDPNVADPDQLGTGGSGVVHVYNDAGTHYLVVNSEGDWTVKVVTTP
jgi:hypothetical protein